jgi:hypothetical protein
MNVNERKSRPKLKCETHSIRRKNLQKVKSQISGFSQQELVTRTPEGNGKVRYDYHLSNAP